MTIEEVTQGLRWPTDTMSPAMYDVAVVGAGPAGIATALSTSSLDLSTVLIDEATPFASLEELASAPTERTASKKFSSISDLTRRLRFLHFSKAPLLLRRRVRELTSRDMSLKLEFMDGGTIFSRVVVAATGACYRRLSIPDYSRFENHGIHYAATGMEAALSIGDDVVVVGGGQTAGQCAVFLSGFARQVHLLIRGSDLSGKMSDYLVERIHHMTDIVVHTGTEIEQLQGESRLEKVTWKDNASGKRESHLINNLFVMIGARANSEWLSDEIERDSDGFVQTGSSDTSFPGLRYATNHPGVYAVGDIRAKSIRSIDAAVLEGFAVANDIHRYVASLDPPLQ